jgi:hypothetical protein
MEAARVAAVHEDILGFTEGYATMVGERGVTLSGGQKQRISIARALLADCPILVLDDALSAVDAKTEEAIIEHFRTADNEQSQIIVAHRLSAVSHTDEIIVLDAGRGWYSGIPTPASLDPSHIRELEDLLAKRFPFLPHYLWSTLQLNPWMHHLSGKGIQFLHMDAEGEQDAADFLRSAGWDVLVNPTSKTAARLVPGPKCLVLRTVRREIDSDGPPTVATVLVDALLENGRLHFMDEVERKEMTRRLMQEKRIDFAALHSRLKNHKKTIEDLIGTGKSGVISEF